MPKEYIGRIEALDACYNGWNMDAATIEAITVNIERIPAADVAEMRHGRWEQVGSIISMYECDQCHTITLGGNFCPSCGARMDGGQDDV